MPPASAILVVDDDSSARSMLSLSLRRAGYRVLTASSGPEALEVLSKTPCEALITDAQMSPMSGFELSRRAKELQPSLRVAMVSAVYGKADAGALPVEVFFQKPVPLEAVIAWLK